MTKKDRYIALRNAGTSREEVREEMGMSASLEQKYNSLYYRDVERNNRKAVEALTDDQRIDGTPKLTPTEAAAQKLEEALGLIERKPEPIIEAPTQDTESERFLPIDCDADTLTVHGDYADYVLRIEVRPVAWNVRPGELAMLGEKLADEMARVERMLAGALS